MQCSRSGTNAEEKWSFFTSTESLTERLESLMYDHWSKQSLVNQIAFSFIPLLDPKAAFR